MTLNSIKSIPWRIFHILNGRKNEMKTRGTLTVFKEIIFNFNYFSYKLSCNQKYYTSRLRSTIKNEELLFKKYIKPGNILLDAGCGDGRNGLKIVEELELHPKKITFLDINEKYLEKIDEFIKKGKSKRYSIFKGSIFNIPFNNETFDVVISTGAVLSLAFGGSIEDGLFEFKRIIKPGGTIIFSIVTIERLLNIAEEQGKIDIKEFVVQNKYFPDWNAQYGEGICKGFSLNEIDEKMNKLGLKILDKQITYQKKIPTSIIIACTKAW